MGYNLKDEDGQYREIDSITSLQVSLEFYTLFYIILYREGERSLRGTSSTQDRRWQTELVNISRLRLRSSLFSVKLTWATFTQLEFRTMYGFGAVHFEYVLLDLWLLCEIDRKRYYMGPLSVYTFNTFPIVNVTVNSQHCAFLYYTLSFYCIKVRLFCDVLIC